MDSTFRTARLEAFSDGVIAVIITIMVLELKVPPGGGWGSLRAVVPAVAVYALSYAFVGIYWINHHLLLDWVEGSTPSILRANLLWLFFLSLLPFFTAYVLEKREDAFSVSLYSASMLTTALSFMLLRLSVNARRRTERGLAREDIAMQSKHWISLGVYLAGIPLAFASAVASLCLIALVTALWVAPGFGVEHLSKASAQAGEPRDSRSPEGV